MRTGIIVDDKKNWVPREEELTDGLNKIQDWIEGREARVRVELR